MIPLALISATSLKYPFHSTRFAMWGFHSLLLKSSSIAAGSADRSGIYPGVQVTREASVIERYDFKDELIYSFKI